MARVLIEEILDYLESKMRRALQEAVRSQISDAEFDPDDLFQDFSRAVRQHCSRWEYVPDHYVKVDLG